MKGFIADIQTLTEGNSDFRRVLYTGKNLQLVLMAIQPGDDILAKKYTKIVTSFSVSKKVKARSLSTATGQKLKVTTR